MKTFLMILTLALSVPSLHAQYQIGGALGGGLSTPMPTPVQMPTLAPALTPSIAYPSAAPAAQAAPAQAAPAASAYEAFSQWSGQGMAQDQQMFVPRGGIFFREEAWSKFWQTLGQPEPCTLDEQQKMAVLIMIGKRPTGGYAPRVVRTGISDGNFLVEYTDGKPSGITTQVVTHPWVIAIVPRSNLPVVYKNIDRNDEH